MNTSSQKFLQRIGATADSHGDIRFASEPATLAELDEATVMVPLAPWGVLSAQGPQSARFLQGQLTCNVLELDDSRSMPGAFCTPKGRMLASFQLMRRSPEIYWLRMRADLLEDTTAALGRYAVFSRTQLAVAPLVGIGLHGAGASDLVAALAGSLPATHHGVVRTEHGLVFRRDSDWFECWLEPAEAAAWWQRGLQTCIPAGSRYWRWLSVRAGIAEVCAATRDTFIPQMFNYTAIGAVSFNKGCYTGQEIVARAHYRGQVKRHLYRAEVNAAAPAVGTELFYDSGRTAGSVVEAVEIRPGLSELLAVLAGDAWESGALRLATDGPVLRALDLPYAIT